MRGIDTFQESLFTTVHLETFVPTDHPLRLIKPLVDQSLQNLNGLFQRIYSERGRDSIPPERLIRAQLLQVLYSIRSERQLVEQIHYNLLYRWFVGLTIDDVVWDHSTFTVNRDRLIENNVIGNLFEEVVNLAKQKDLLSDDHFSVDGTLIRAWASQKSFVLKDKDDDSDAGGSSRNADVNFKGEKRSNKTHASTTDSEALLAKKGPGKEAHLSYMGHTVMENRNGLIVQAEASQATGKAEREIATKLLSQLSGSQRKTVGADKNYDTADFVKDCREMNITPHVARNDKRRGGSAIDGRTSSKKGYKVSQKIRKRVEEPFGWGKTIGLIRQIKQHGLANANHLFQLTMIGWNLIRISNLQEQYA
jgi:transposase